MNRAALTVALLVLAGSALAGDPPPRPTGTMLLDAAPRQADIVVHAPDLPALYESAARAGLGDAPSWRAAFEAQLTAWAALTRLPERLVKGGGALLDGADGEALLASFSMKLPNTSGVPTRATLLAIRSSLDEKTLRAAIVDVVDGGLRPRYEGEPREEEIGGRRVLTLPGNLSSLHILVQNGLVVVCDHPLALGLFLQGLGRPAAASARRSAPAGQMKLDVRYGRGEGAWEGWLWGEGESVSWKTDKAGLAVFDTARSEENVCGIATSAIADLPLLPRPLAAAERAAMEKAAATAREFDASTAVQSIGLTSRTAVVGMTPVGDPIGPVGRSTVAGPGGAWRLGWLRALAEGRLASPLPEADPAHLVRVRDAALKTAGASAGEFIPWKSGDQPGELRGPLGHGPATFLALRALHDIGHGLVPCTVAPEDAGRKERPEAPLPPPAEGADK